MTQSRRLILGIPRMAAPPSRPYVFNPKITEAIMATDQIRHYVHGRFTVEELLDMATTVLPEREEALRRAAAKAIKEQSLDEYRAVRRKD